MGLRGPRSTLNRVRPAANRRRRRAHRRGSGPVLTASELVRHHEEKWLTYGPYDDEPCPFTNRAAAKRAWKRYRKRIFYPSGHRPYGWWLFEGPFDRPSAEDEPRELFLAGLLTPAENDKILARWRKVFEETERPDYYWIGDIIAGTTVCEVLNGAAARQARLREVGVPDSLVREWQRRAEAQRWAKSR
jgi:hypothetical protein